VTVPARVVGWNYNKKIFLWLRGFWTRSVNPACPVCDRGVLLCDHTNGPVREASSPDGPLQLFPWTCCDCGFGLLEVSRASVARETAARLRQQRAQAAFTQLQMEERAKLARGHRIGSRIFYVVAALTFANFVNLLMIGAPILFSINWATFSFMFWVFGMKRAYRAWQVSNGHLFKAGAFWHWFKHGKWLI
jgi:hypothetical protein